MAKVLKPFLFEGRIVHPGDEISPAEQHHKDLALSGMVDKPVANTRRAKPKPPASAPPPEVAVKSAPRKPSRRTIVGK